MRSRLAAVLMVVSFVAAPARASNPSNGSLQTQDGSASWAGSFTDAFGFAVPELCPLTGCDTYTLTVGDVFADGGRLQISINWPDEDNDLDLFVYGPDGSLAGRSDGFFASTGESVRLASTAPGDYTVVVTPRLVEGTMGYEGLAEVEFPSSVEGELLPNLVALAPRNLNLQIGQYLTAPAPVDVVSCYPEETLEQGATRCLRFDQIIANLGDGPFELRYRMEGLATDQQLVQRIYSSDGSFRDRQADTYEFHAAHAHFHYRNFAQSRLYKETDDGLVVVREGRKNGFCMIDVENTMFGPGIKGEAPRTYYFPRCNAPTERDGTGTYMTNGISVGWADVYNWFLADQFIEVTGVEPGDYVLETVADEVGTIQESDETDNAVSVRIRLTETGAEFIG